MEVRNFDAACGAEVLGLDMTLALDDETKSQINRTFVDNVVLCFRDQRFDTPEKFLVAARALGEPFPPIVNIYRLPGHVEIEELTNQATDKRTGGTKRLNRGGSWHTDHSNIECPPKATALYAVEIPSRGGNTEFVNMFAAYDALSAEQKAFLEGRRAFHAYLSRRAPRQLLTRSKKEEAQTEGVWQPIVRKHPVTGRKALYLNPMRIDQVEGLDREEGDRLMDELFAHCDQPQFQYSHEWRIGDMLVWDNCASQHQATFDFDPSERRYLLRIMLKGDKPLLA